MNPTQDLKQKLQKVPRIKLARLPTPLEEMPHLTQHLKGPRIWIKRDDLTGIAFGGNKERKTEYVMADALSKNADVVITTGSVQFSNHARTTAAAARKLGLNVVLVLHGEEPENYDGNLLLDYLYGADIRFIDERKQEISDKDPMEQIAEELTSKGHVPYIIPMGASYTIGAVAYANAMLELNTQAQEHKLKIDHIIHAAGSGGTQAGFILANKVLETGTTIHGISAEPDCQWLKTKTIQIANDTAKYLNIKTTITPTDVTLNEKYSGKEYAELTPEATEAIKLVARTEGILLDPVYTGKAMAGLIDMTRHGQFNKDQNVVFIHTGGTLAVFQYGQQLTKTKKYS